MGEKFRHTSLEGPDTIRLLRLEPDLPLRGTIEHHALSKAPAYRALSYTWACYWDKRRGDAYFFKDVPGFTMLLDGRSYQILENLYEFMNTICERMNEAELLWCDYLCIDQVNVHERNHQVSMMGQIYRRAFEVLAWIGNYESPSADDLDYLRASAIVRYETPLGPTVTDASYQRQVLALNERRDRIMLHPYWNRAWITQELFLARKVTLLCGLSNCTFEALESLSKWPPAEREGCNPLRISISEGKLGKMMEYKKQESKAKLERLFRDYASSECADFHDKVYSLIALAEDGDRFPVDYQTSSPEFCCLFSLMHTDMTEDEASVLQKNLCGPFFRLQFLFVRTSETGWIDIALSLLETWQLYQLPNSRTFEQVVRHRLACPNCQRMTAGNECLMEYPIWWQVLSSIATSILTCRGAVKSRLSIEGRVSRWIIWAEWPTAPDMTPKALLKPFSKKRLRPGISDRNIMDAIGDVKNSFQGSHPCDRLEGGSGDFDVDGLRVIFDRIPIVRLSDYATTTEEKERRNRKHWMSSTFRRSSV